MWEGAWLVAMVVYVCAVSFASKGFQYVSVLYLALDNS